MLVVRLVYVVFDEVNQALSADVRKGICPAWSTREKAAEFVANQPRKHGYRVVEVPLDTLMVGVLSGTKGRIRVEVDPDGVPKIGGKVHDFEHGTVEEPK